MRFFIYGVKQYSPTDGIIYKGMENLLNEIYDNPKLIYLPRNLGDKRDFSMLTDDELYSNKKFDAIIIPGSPFLQHIFYKRAKILNINRIREIHQCPVIWLGIGDCMPLDDTGLLDDDIHQEMIQRIYNFGEDLIIVRSKITKGIFDRACIDSTFLPCPSYFCYGRDFNFKKTKDNLMVQYEPSIGLSFTYQNDKARLYEYYLKFLKNYLMYKPDIVCAMEEEVEYATKLGLPAPRVLKNAKDTMDTVRKYRNVFSGRVHVGVPAKVSEANVDLIPIDSRYATLTDVNNFDYDITYEAYKSLIKNYLGF